MMLQKTTFISQNYLYVFYMQTLMLMHNHMHAAALGDYILHRRTQRL